jgi:hypothetical protein
MERLGKARLGPSGRVEIVEEGVVHNAEDGRLPVNEPDRDAHERKSVDKVGGPI